MSLTEDVGMRELAQSFIEEEIVSLESVSGGLVHHVFHIRTATASYFLKRLGTSFAGIPSIESRPSDIQFEAEALRLLEHYPGPIFPKVVGLNIERGVLLITGIMESEHHLLRKMQGKEFGSSDAESIGSQIADIHCYMAGILKSVRTESDNEYYEENLRFRFGAQNDSHLDELSEVLRLRPRQLILGDVSPKNLGIVNGELRVCDLEDAHRGNREFDTGFLSGHLLLHWLQERSPSPSWAESFMQGYKEKQHISTDEENLVVRVALATMLYRLRHTLVPYPLSLTKEERFRLTAVCAAMFGEGVPAIEEVASRLREVCA